MARRVWVSSSLKQIMRIEKVGFQIYRVVLCKGIPVLIDICDSNDSKMSFFPSSSMSFIAEGSINSANNGYPVGSFPEISGLEARKRDRLFTNEVSSCHQLKWGQKFKLWKPEENGKKGCFVNVKCLYFERWACNWCLLFIPSSSHHHINLSSFIHISLIPRRHFFVKNGIITTDLYQTHGQTHW